MPEPERALEPVDRGNGAAEVGGHGQAPWRSHASVPGLAAAGDSWRCGRAL